MSKISVLPKNVAELIAAGEVVERPASVIKELVENSIDAGATSITVEIKGGGILYMRVSDNGSGIEPDDVRTAFKRHATSKIKNQNDLDAISTLGFRGEALAAVSSVAKVELITCTKGSLIGTRYLIAGGEEVLFEEAGCSQGTSIIVRDIFYNTPARMKFLKKDVTEANSVAAIIERIALSHPEIAFKFIRDGKTALTSVGDGKLKSAVYSILGRDFAAGLIEVDGEQDKIRVSGLIGKPTNCRSNRNGQFFFLNNRFVKSGTITAALEQAYKNTVMVGKFPCAVINVTVPFDCVDVNVHPAKTEVRFSDERRIFSAVYYTVKNALTLGDTRPQMQIKQKSAFEHITAQQYREQYAAQKPQKNEYVLNDFVQTVAQNTTLPISLPDEAPKAEIKQSSAEQVVYTAPKAVVPTTVQQQIKQPPVYDEPKPSERAEDTTPQRKVRYIGEAFKTYIIAECDDGIYFIDKHAAHERINFENLKKTQKIEQQRLLSPLAITLTANDYTVITENMPLIEKAGFEIEDFGNSSILVCTVPAMLTGCDTQSIIIELAACIENNKTEMLPTIERIFHTVSCKAAIKAGNNNSAYELEKLAQRVLNDNDIMYCPHGRPVAIKLSEKEIEKQFGRIQ